MMNISRNIICVLDQRCNTGWSPVNVLKQFTVNFGLKHDKLLYNTVTPALQTSTVVIMNRFLGSDPCLLVHVYKPYLMVLQIFYDLRGIFPSPAGARKNASNE